MPKGFTEAADEAADKALALEATRMDEELRDLKELLAKSDNKRPLQQMYKSAKPLGLAADEADNREAKTRQLNETLVENAEDYQDAEKVRLGGPANPSKLQQAYEAIMAKFDDKEDQET